MKLNKRYWNLYKVSILYSGNLRDYIYPENKRHEKWFFNYNLILNCFYKFKIKKTTYFICG